MSSTRLEAEEVSLLDVLVDSGLAVTPRGEVTAGQAKKLIKSNAVSVNGVKIASENEQLTRSGALHGRFHIVQKGKKQHHLVVMS